MLSWAWTTKHTAGESDLLDRKRDRERDTPNLRLIGLESDQKEAT